MTDDEFQQWRDEITVEGFRALVLEAEALKMARDKAVQVIDQYAGFDGCHHKQWVIDQVLRCLLQSDYEEWVAELEKDCDNEWDTGIAP